MLVLMMGRIFIRRMASDKVVLAMILLTVLGIIAAIAVYIYRKQTGQQNVRSFRIN